MSYKNFSIMLNKLYQQLDNKKKEFVLCLPEPKISKKPTRLDWLNINMFLKKINRSPEHFIHFLKDERKISVSYQRNILIIQGKFKIEDINKIILEYVNKYCKCLECGCYDTLLIRDGSTRKDKINCHNCHSTKFC